MADVTAIKTIREKTQAPLGAIRKALEAAHGNEARALQILREQGASVALKRAGRAAGEGRIEAYIHHDGKVGAIVEVNCETYFVARTPEFQQFCRDLAMQVTAKHPQYLAKDEVKPEHIASSGMAAPAFLQEACLLEQPFIKDAGQTIGQYVEAMSAKTGERVVVKRFLRLQVGGA